MSAEAAGTNQATGGNGGKLVMILSGVNLLATLAIVAFLIISFNRDAKKPRVSDISEHAEAQGVSHEGGAAEDGEAGGKRVGAQFGKMVTLDQFTVNLSSPGAANPKFVRANISLQVPGADAESEVGQKMPQVRNAIIDLFNSKRPGDLATTDGRNTLKEEIRNTLNSFMVSGKVMGVFFTNFAVSS